MADFWGDAVVIVVAVVELGWGGTSECGADIDLNKKYGVVLIHLLERR